MYINGQVRIFFGYGANGLIVPKKSENEGFLTDFFVKEIC
jgi:hypothetical protein